MWLLTNWKSILTVTATGVVAFLLHAVDVDRLEAKQRADISNAIQAMAEKCEAAKKITEDISDEYRKKSNALSAELDHAKRMHSSTCVAVRAAGAAAGSHATAGVNKSVATNGNIAANDLLDIAGEGERYRLQLNSCQSFWSRVEELNKKETK